MTPIIVNLVLGIGLIVIGIILLDCWGCLLQLPAGFVCIVGGYIMIFKSMVKLLPKHNLGMWISIGIPVLTILIYVILCLPWRRKPQTYSTNFDRSEPPSYKPMVRDAFGDPNLRHLWGKDHIKGEEK